MEQDVVAEAALAEVVRAALVEVARAEANACVEETLGLGCSGLQRVDACAE